MSRRPLLLAYLALLSLTACGDIDNDPFGGGSGGGSVCPPNQPPIPSCEDNGGCAGGEQGRMQGIVDAHNRLRAALSDPAPDEPLPPLVWSDDLAAVARQWALHLKENEGCNLVHSTDCRYGENLAWFQGQQPSAASVTEDGWGIEKACYSYGAFLNGDRCSSDCMAYGGCGHYTQMIWRGTREVGCAVESCSPDQEVWVCNYAPVGNIIGRFPY